MAESTDAAVVEAPKPTLETLWPDYEAKMQAEGLKGAAINAFKYSYEVLVSGKSTMIPESALAPVDGLPSLDSVQVEPDPSLLKETVVLKLNGGLGTSMGLEKAKSLLYVTKEYTFLDLMALQVTHLRGQYGVDLSFMLMNSFSTSADTLNFLQKFPELSMGKVPLQLMQNKAPKVAMGFLTPASHPEDPSMEWCPPGHGDLYPALFDSGILDSLILNGKRYMFVSNSDNLGATLDLKILKYFASSKAPFLMEVAQRTEADKKGGHLARDAKTGGLTLRESAQCPPEDEAAFQDTAKYKYFNTNNLWIDLVALRTKLTANKGMLPLPVMVNEKTVNPRDKESSKVIQLETAMGAAISCFDGAAALLIPRSRFAPVKTTNDLLALRSDAYELTDDYRIVLAESRKGVPPLIKLDPMYKFVEAMEGMLPHGGVPSLLGCERLIVEGDVEFGSTVVLRRKVTFKGARDGKRMIASSLYENQIVDLDDALELPPPGPKPTIQHLIAREIFDSRGNPTVEVDLLTETSMFRAAVPSGASTGAHEAAELRDGDKARLRGKGVLKAVENINMVIAPKLFGKEVTAQKEIDDIMCKELDGSPNKSKLGANAILAVSMAVCRAGAASEMMPLYKYVAKLARKPMDKWVMPVPSFNVINGGKHAGNRLACQEFMIMPVGASSFKDAMVIGAEVYHILKKVIKEKYGMDACNVGDEGGFAPNVQDNTEALKLLMEAIKQSKHADKIKIATDVAASEFYNKAKKEYNLDFKNKAGSSAEMKMDPARLAGLYKTWIKDYPLVSIEDPFDQDDWESWAWFTADVGKEVQIVGDDLLVTNPTRIATAIQKGACNALLCKVNQIGTVTEALEAVRMCQEKRWGVMVSHRSGETEDSFIADLVVGLRCGQIKTGAPCRSERLAKYNQLIRIEEELGGNCSYAGVDFRDPK